MKRGRKKGDDKRMAVLTAKCLQAFRVSPEQLKRFLEHKTDTKVKSKTQSTLMKISAKLNKNNDKA